MISAQELARSIDSQANRKSWLATASNVHREETFSKSSRALPVSSISGTDVVDGAGDGDAGDERGGDFSAGEAAEEVAVVGGGIGD